MTQPQRRSHRTTPVPIKIVRQPSEKPLQSPWISANPKDNRPANTTTKQQNIPLPSTKTTSRLTRYLLLTEEGKKQGRMTTKKGKQHCYRRSKTGVNLRKEKARSLQREQRSRLTKLKTVRSSSSSRQPRCILPSRLFPQNQLPSERPPSYPQQRP